MTPSIEEALRSGAVRLVDKPDIEAVVYRVANAKLGEGPSVRCEGPTDFEKDQARHWVRRILSALSASPDHTPALVALIEERDRLKVERNEARQIADDLAWAEKKRDDYAEMLATSAAFALAAEAERGALREQIAKLKKDNT